MPIWEMPNLADEPIELENENEEDDDEDEELTAIDEGFACATCGLDFQTPQSGPSLCPSCWRGASEDDRKLYAEAKSDVVAAD